MMIKAVEANLAVPAHAAALLQLLNEYALDPMGGAEALSDHVKQNLIQQLQQRPTARAILAFDGELPVGLIICFEGFSTFACQPLFNLHDVVVSQNYRGKGVLKLMLQEVETIARRLGCCKLTMEILEGNQHAMAAYRAHGFAGYELDPTMGKAVFWQKKLA
ncbi:GNAT superfamily N-acetyltransferase [Oxalobacteraceae bacterium GrIS 2.11]